MIKNPHMWVLINVTILKNNIIFLDIDGVLNVNPKKFDKYGPCFEEVFVKNLSKLIEATSSKIVISSTWKMSGLKVLKSMWEDRNLPGYILDVTPSEVDVVESGKCEFYDLVDRGHEIEQWVKTNSNIILNYCILDDIDDMLPSQKPYLIKTSGNFEDPQSIKGYGLTKILSDKAINILQQI